MTSEEREHVDRLLVSLEEIAGSLKILVQTIQAALEAEGQGDGSK